MHNLALLENGHAEVLIIPPNDRYEQAFRRAEQDAKSGGGEGLWSACDEPDPAPTPSGGGDGDDEAYAPAPDPDPVEPSGGGVVRPSIS